MSHPSFHYKSTGRSKLCVVKALKRKLVFFRNLRVIELAGGVSDKVMCNALWNVNKKSDKVLELAVKESKVSHRSIYHQEQRFFFTFVAVVKMFLIQ